jgi:hypothetical protein
MELGKGESLSSAALRSGMSENTARRYRAGELPGQRKSPRQYRTRPDPFAEVWPEIEAMLEQAPGLEAVTIFEALRGRAELSFSDGQLRTLQRRIRRWRASQGPDREVLFSQQHRPGEYAQSDFTSMNELGICLGGERFEHLFFHFVLPYSNWETGGICFSESFEALIGGFQAAVWELGKAPKLHRTDNLSAATHELRDGARAFNDRYLAAELKRLDRFDALILDDLGYVEQSREEMEVLFTLIAERYERRSVLITSNLVFSKWDQIFKDPMTTAAAVDRIVHHSIILELNVESYRAQAAKARATGVKEPLTPTPGDA